MLRPNLKANSEFLPTLLVAVAQRTGIAKGRAVKKKIPKTECDFLRFFWGGCLISFCAVFVALFSNRFVFSITAYFRVTRSQGSLRFVILPGWIVP